MMKFKISMVMVTMVTRELLYLTKDTFLDVVERKNFPLLSVGWYLFTLLSVGWYLFRVVSGNRYLPRCSNENVLYITSTGNVFVASGNHTTFGFCHDSLNSEKTT